MLFIIRFTKHLNIYNEKRALSFISCHYVNTKICINYVQFQRQKNLGHRTHYKNVVLKLKIHTYILFCGVTKKVLKYTFFGYF